MIQTIEEANQKICAILLKNPNIKLNTISFRTTPNCVSNKCMAWQVINDDIGYCSMIDNASEQITQGNKIKNKFNHVENNDPDLTSPTGIVSAFIAKGVEPGLLVNKLGFDDVTQVDKEGWCEACVLYEKIDRDGVDTHFTKQFKSELLYKKYIEKMNEADTRESLINIWTKAKFDKSNLGNTSYNKLLQLVEKLNKEIRDKETKQ